MVARTLDVLRTIPPNHNVQKYVEWLESSNKHPPERVVSDDFVTLYTEGLDQTEFRTGTDRKNSISITKNLAQ